MSRDADRVTRLNILIRNCYNTFGQQEKKIADYVLEHEDEILTTPLSSLAGTAGTSEATAVRFCKKLGFRGIKEFKVFLATVKSSGTEADSCSFGDSDKTVFEKVFRNSMRALEYSYKSTTFETLSKVADYINSSASILVFGVGGSAIAAEFVVREIARLGKKVFSSTDSYSIRQFNADFAPEDLVMIVSRSGETEDLIRIAEKAKAEGAVVVAVTGAKESTLTGISDTAIIVKEEQLIEGDRNSYSRIGQISLVSCLYIMCVAHRMKEDDSFRENYFGLTNYR